MCPPQDRPRTDMLQAFLCDEMLARLGRWLRAAGYDTAIATPGTPDSRLLDQARREARILLTCDTHLASFPGRDQSVLLLPGHGVEAQVNALSRLLPIDWLLAPFSRCVVDNAPLRPATAAERDEAPALARALDGAFLTCPACGRLYWPGSHHRRMHRRLSGWAAAARSAPTG